MVIWSESLAESSGVQIHDEQTFAKSKQTSVVEVDDDVENASVRLEERDYKRKQARSVSATLTMVSLADPLRFRCSKDGCWHGLYIYALPSQR